MHGWQPKFVLDGWKKIDTVMKKKKLKTLLFLEQYPAQWSETDFLENIKVIFFPTNCINVPQLCDLGLIKNLKMHFRKQLSSTHYSKHWRA